MGINRAVLIIIPDYNLLNEILNCNIEHTSSTSTQFLRLYNVHRTNRVKNKHWRFSKQSRALGVSPGYIPRVGGGGGPFQHFCIACPSSALSFLNWEAKRLQNNYFQFWEGNYICLHGFGVLKESKASTIFYRQLFDIFSIKGTARLRKEMGEYIIHNA